jgi:hypothetical protein
MTDAAFAVGEPDVVDRMLDRVQAGLAANIQPVRRAASFCRVTSSTPMKPPVSGVSVEAVCSRARGVTWRGLNGLRSPRE